MPGKRLLCFVLIAGLILPGCASKRASAPPPPAGPIPSPVNPGEAAPYDRKNADEARRLGALRIVCEDVRFARAARPAYLLPDLPQIREYFADYYRIFVDKGVSDTRISEQFRELYAPYARTADVQMEQKPPQVSFERLPAGSYIVFFAPQRERPAENAPLDVFLLRVRLVAAKTTTLTLSEMDIPLPGDRDQKARRLLAKDAPLPPGGKEEDAILLPSGERLLWPEGVVLRLPVLPPPQQRKERNYFLESLVWLGILALYAYWIYIGLTHKEPSKERNTSGNSNFY